MQNHAVGDNSVHDRGSCPRFSFKIGGIELCGLDCKIRRGIERIVEADVSESVSHPLSPFCLPSGSIFCSCRSLFSRYFYIKPRGYFDISHFILWRMIKVVTSSPKNRPHAGRGTVGQIPLKLRKRGLRRGGSPCLGGTLAASVQTEPRATHEGNVSPPTPGRGH